MMRFESDDHYIDILHDQKMLFPACQVTKGELASYYQRIAPVMLPHIRGRQLTMQRFPAGVEEEGFYQKDAPHYFPLWIKRSCSKKKTNGTICYVVPEKAADLVYMASQDAIVYHVSLSRVDKPQYPDRLIFDLDPSDNDWKKVRAAATYLRVLLEKELKLTTFIMTTGSRGVHIVIPLNRRYDFDTTKAFARDCAELLAHRHPGLLTTEVRKEHRGDRVFIDYLRNAYGQTGIAPYSVRARANASIATPLSWQEFKTLKVADLYTIKNIFKRLARKDDPWKNIDKQVQSLKKAVMMLEFIIKKTKKGDQL